MEPKRLITAFTSFPPTCPYPEPPRSSLLLAISLLEDTFYIILPSAPSSSKWPLSFRSPHQKPLYTPLLSPIRATCPSHIIFLILITRIILVEQYRSLTSSLCSLQHSPVTSSLFVLRRWMFFSSSSSSSSSLWRIRLGYVTLSYVTLY